MTAPQRSPDPESLLQAGPRRCPCRSLDWCLLVGLCALGAALLGFALCGGWRVLPRPLETPAALTHTGKEAGAQIFPTSDLIKNMTMAFDHLPGMEGVVFSSNFNYHESEHKLEVKVGGLYFIYAQLAVKCVVKECSKKQTVGLIINQVFGDTGRSVQVLTVSLHLSSKSEETMSKFSAVLRPLRKGSFLCVTMNTSETNDDWQLDPTNRKDNFFGLFRVPSSDESADPPSASSQ